MNLKTNRFFCIALAIIKFSLLIIPTQADVLYDFNTNLEGFTRFGEVGTPSLAHSLTEGTQGSGAMIYSLGQGARFGGVFNSTNIPITDWSSFDTISFYVKADNAVAGNQIRIQFKESNGEVWKQEKSFEPKTTFEKVEIKLVSSLGDATDDGFVVEVPGDNEKGGESFSLDLDEITKVIFVVIPNGSTPPDRVTYYIDTIELNEVDISVSLSISEDAINFGGPLVASVSNHRFSSDVLTVDYATPIGSTWEIRLYTTRDDGIEGLVATSGTSTSTIPLKFDPDADDDPEDDSAFGFPGSSPEDLRFFFVLDDGTEDAQGLPFFSKLASSSGGDPSSNDSKLVNFAIDASGAIANTTYSTEVTFELYVAE